MKRLFLIFNPKAGRADFAKNLPNVIKLFSRADYMVTVYPTSGSGDAERQIQEHAPEFDLIVCSGGDGIMNEAVNAYMKSESPPPLAYIPSGTTNDFAISLGMPLQIMKAAKAILNGQPRLIDAGKFGSRFFTYVAAFGQFTDVPYITDQNAKNAFGRMAYLIEGAKHIVNITEIECTVDIDGESLSGKFLIGIITNSKSVGGFKVQSNGTAAIDDGLFEVLLIRRPNTLSEHSELMAILTNNMTAATEIVVQRNAKRVVFKSKKPCSWTLDGEYGGRHTDVVIENLPRALNIIVPQ